jgi:TRAP-type C4-dicarboxylate transport system substrate-binding protein
MGAALVAGVQYEAPAPIWRQRVGDEDAADRRKEVDMSKTRPVRRAVLAVLVALAVAGCTSQGGDKAGGPGDPVVLRMATLNGEPGYNPQIDYLISRVKELSAGNVRIDMVYRVGEFEPDAEQRIVRGVADGTYDLAVVGTRIFDTLDVKSFQALSVPMLIDSYELERAVVESDIPAQMLRSLDKLDVTGLGVLADGLRKPIAVEKPLLGPEDWRGITFAAFRSNVGSQAIRALGAAPSEAFGPSLDKGLDSGDIQGFEKNLLAYQINNMAKRAPYVTANVNLWPQTLAAIGNRDRLAELTAEQRGWLTQAVRDTAARSTGLVNGDAASLSELCAAGARFRNASESDIAGLREAFAPLLEDLEQDAQTKEFMEEIERLKQQIGPGEALVIPNDCTPAASIPESTPPPKTTTPTPLDGEWEVTYTRDELIAAHPDPSEVQPENYGHYGVTFDRGGFSYELLDGSSSSSTATGTYIVDGDTITFYLDGVPDWWKYRWSVYNRDSLTFEKLGGYEPICTPNNLGQCEPTGFVVKPWRRVSG